MNRNDFTGGILLVDKEKDWTSHDVCAFVRNRFKIKKVGHAGTLDPAATGLLVLLLGQATKISGQLTGHDKDYEGTFRLGVKTDSHDMQGKVIEEGNAEGISVEIIREKAKKYLGELEQTPPMVSAVKHKGKPLYKLARQGKVVERESRPINIYQFDIHDKKENEVHFFCSVSKGTYVRVLANDLGEDLGCFAALSSLRRMRSGDFEIKNAISIPALKEMKADDIFQYILPIDKYTTHANC